MIIEYAMMNNSFFWASRKPLTAKITYECGNGGGMMIDDCFIARAGLFGIHFNYNPRVSLTIQLFNCRCVLNQNPCSH